MELVSTSIQWHVGGIVLLLGVIVFNLYSVLKIENFMELSKRLKVLTPIFHTLNLVVAYTGAIVSAFSHDLSITVILMSITTIFIMVLEIKRYKKMRVIKLAEIEKQNEFRKFAKRVYLLQISALVTTFVISKLF
ncbi:MAG: hypothetical protein U9Q30_02075 [Campylobacterota bacterium]|nr:hypothetical protein [Campylobacterota bacterium]